MLAATNDHQKQEVVLTKALVNVASLYDLSGKDLRDIIGLSEATTTRLHQGKKFISPTTKEGEMAILLIRVYRSLNSILGNHHEKAKQWLRSYNHYFSQKPIDKLRTLPGLLSVVNYLDAMRGKL
jgi:uncharacterized protein (DUF2384 family)